MNAPHPMAWHILDAQQNGPFFLFLSSSESLIISHGVKEHMKIHENSELNSCSLKGLVVAYGRHLPLKYVSRELREWKAMLQHSGGKSRLWMMGGVKLSISNQPFIKHFKSVTFATTEFPHKRSDSLTMIIPLFGTLFPIPKRLPDLQHGHFRQNILHGLATCTVWVFVWTWEDDVNA